jgi:hypothetical protein
MAKKTQKIFCVALIHKKLKYSHFVTFFKKIGATRHSKVPADVLIVWTFVSTKIH